MFPLHENEIEEFILCDDKPDWCRATDVAVMVYLMVLAGENGVCSARQVKIALCTGGGAVNWKSTREALNRMHQYNWITWKRPLGSGERDEFQVHFDRIPPHPQVLKKKEGHEPQTEG